MKELTIGEALLEAISMLSYAGTTEIQKGAAETLRKLVAYTPEEFLRLCPPNEPGGDLEEPESPQIH